MIKKLFLSAEGKNHAFVLVTSPFLLWGFPATLTRLSQLAGKTDYFQGLEAREPA